MKLYSRGLEQPGTFLLLLLLLLLLHIAKLANKNAAISA